MFKGAAATGPFFVFIMNISYKILFSYCEVFPEDINQKAISIAVYGPYDVY